MRKNELIIYRSFTQNNKTEGEASLFNKMDKVMTFIQSENDKEVESSLNYKQARDLFYECINLLLESAGGNGFYGNLWHDYLANLLVNDENSYSTACEIRGEVEGSVNDAVLHDIGVIKEYFDFDFTQIINMLNVPEAEYILDYRANEESSKIYNKRIRDRICSLALELEKADSAKTMKEDLTQFYKEYGVGKFGLHKAFRIEEDKDGTVRIVPINKILHVYLDDLVGYEKAKKKLVDNTDAFVARRPANNCLLYGEAGTGKSSSIKAIANEYYDKGLRIIECYRYQFRCLNEVISQIKNRNYRFIIYMDDLSFEEFETEYKYLKAVIEGGLEKKPSNVLIYATSNRRHLVRESFADRDGAEIGDKHHGDTVQEKLSLSGRFGVSIYYGAPTFDEYQEIVAELAKRYGLAIEGEELRKEATRWEMYHGGLSGRTAQQFIDYLRGFEPEEAQK